MTEKYEQTGETQVEHARINKIRSISTCYEIAVNKEAYEAIASFTRSRSTMSISFDASLNGYTELFSLYRFMNEEKTRMNMFIHTDQNGYEEIICINVFGGPKDMHVNCATVDGHSYSFYGIDDVRKYDVGCLISHIRERMLKLINMLENDNDADNKAIVELAFEYMGEVYKSYK